MVHGDSKTKVNYISSAITGARVDINNSIIRKERGFSMFCKNCGKNLSDDALFCTNCGEKLKKTEEKIQSADVPPPPSKEPDIPEPPKPPKETTTSEPPPKQPEPPKPSPSQSQQPAPPPPMAGPPPPAANSSPPRQTSYNPPPRQNTGIVDVNNQPLSVGQYLLMFIVLAIPFVNIIMLLVWGFGGNANINKKNYARASMLLFLIMIGISIVIGIIAGILALMGSFGATGGYY